MAVFAYHYVYNPARADTMDEVRPRHRHYLGVAAQEGKVLASGPYTDAREALIIVRADSAEDAASLMDNDPFYREGYVLTRSVHPWNDVLGAFKDL